MPKLNHAVPSYRHHKASGQAFVELNGKRIYLGKFKSATSKTEYERLIGEFLSSGRQLADETAAVTVTEVCIDYVKKADGYYRKNGQHTNEFGTAKGILKELRTLYGKTDAAEFGPIAFKAFRQRLIDRGLRRTTINHYLVHVVAAFRLAVENEKLPVHVYQALRAVERLRQGRTAAKESRRVLAVDVDLVEKTLPHLPPIVADMVRLQRLTAMRPAEVCNLRPCDVVRTCDVWIYTPATHKTEHHGRPRIIPIGREAQAILAPYLLRSAEAYCFSPAETMEQSRRKRNLNRKTPMSCGNRPGTNRKRNPKKVASNQYDSCAYGRCIREVCKRHDLPTWAPNQLRKLAATNIRKVCDLEAAQVILGHSSKAVTEAYYADPDIAAAVEVARKIG